MAWHFVLFKLRNAVKARNCEKWRENDGSIGEGKEENADEENERRGADRTRQDRREEEKRGQERTDGRGQERRRQ